MAFIIKLLLMASINLVAVGSIFSSYTYTSISSASTSRTITKTIYSTTTYHISSSSSNDSSTGEDHDPVGLRNLRGNAPQDSGAWIPGHPYYPQTSTVIPTIPQILPSDGVPLISKPTLPNARRDLPISHYHHTLPVIPTIPQILPSGIPISNPALPQARRVLLSPRANHEKAESCHGSHAPQHEGLDYFSIFININGFDVEIPISKDTSYWFCNCITRDEKPGSSKASSKTSSTSFDDGPPNHVPPTNKRTSTSSRKTTSATSEEQDSDSSPSSSSDDPPHTHWSYKPHHKHRSTSASSTPTNLMIPIGSLSHSSTSSASDTSASDSTDSANDNDESGDDDSHEQWDDPSDIHSASSTRTQIRLHSSTSSTSYSTWDSHTSTHPSLHSNTVPNNLDSPASVFPGYESSEPKHPTKTVSTSNPDFIEPTPGPNPAATASSATRGRSGDAPANNPYPYPKPAPTYRSSSFLGMEVETIASENAAIPRFRAPSVIWKRGRRGEGEAEGLRRVGSTRTREEEERLSETGDADDGDGEDLTTTEEMEESTTTRRPRTTFFLHPHSTSTASEDMDDDTSSAGDFDPSSTEDSDLDDPPTTTLPHFTRPSSSPPKSSHKHPTTTFPSPPPTNIGTAKSSDSTSEAPKIVHSFLISPFWWSVMGLFWASGVWQFGRGLREEWVVVGGVRGRIGG